MTESRTRRTHYGACTLCEIMRGVVSLPHGWGHQRDGVRQGVARSVAGASANDVTSEGFIDVLTGTAALSGVAVEVTRAFAVETPLHGMTIEGVG